MNESVIEAGSESVIRSVSESVSEGDSVSQ